MTDSPTRRRATTIVALACACIAASVAATASSAAAAPASVPGSSSPAEFSPGGISGAASTARRGRTTGPWRWSMPPRAWSRSSGVLPAALVNRGATARVSRGQFLVALLRVEAMRAAAGTDSQPRSLLVAGRAAPALRDARAGSLAARAVAHGWMTAPDGRFRFGAPITANEAALAMAGMLELRRDVVLLTIALRREVPGARVTLYSSAHALSRTLGLRYNVEDPYDELDLGPNEAVNVAHAAYMLHVAATGLSSWKLDEARALATTFELPELGPNQQRVLATGVRMLGQPYVWGGETEGRQAEGKGGFDCSGFAVRVVNQSGVPSSQLELLAERTTYTQSVIPRAERITAAQLQPGDVMFFGDRGPASLPTQNFHAGIAMGNGWFIHSSGGNAGVAIDRLDGWWGERYSWGRRALLQP